MEATRNDFDAVEQLACSLQYRSKRQRKIHHGTAHIFSFSRWRSIGRMLPLFRERA
jgi:hypothetical protein